MYFFVRIEFNWPDWDSETFAERWAAELKREVEVVCDYMDRGILVRMWRKPGDKGNFGLWKADSIEDIHKVLKDLPMWRFFKAEVTPFMEHEVHVAYKKSRGKLPVFPEGF